MYHYNEDRPWNTENISARLAVMFMTKKKAIRDKALLRALVGKMCPMIGVAQNAAR